MTNRGKFKKALKRKALESHDRIAFSFHESGHVLFGFLNFMKVLEVSVFINKKNETEGFMDYETPVDEEFEANCEDPDLFNFWLKSEIGLAYSGFCAEKFYWKQISGSDVVPLFLKDGSSDDILSAAELIKKHDLAPPGQKRYRLKQKMIKETSKTLIEHWSDVVLLSHALFEKKKLNFLELKDLLSKKSEEKEFWKERFKDIEYLFGHQLDTKERRRILVES